MTEQPFTENQHFKIFSFTSIIIITLFAVALNPVYGQTNAIITEAQNNERIIKGLVSNDDGPLKGVNVIQKDTEIGTVTNEKGEFTFPSKLKTGDILLFSYLGYETQSIKIKNNTSFIKLELTPDLVEMIGALDSGKPYKSKRKKN